MADYTPKNWQNYPSEQTPILAEDLTRMEQQILDTKTSLSNLRTRFERFHDSFSMNLESLIDGVFPTYIKVIYDETISSESTLKGNPSYYLIPAAEFDPAIDGLLVWRDSTNLVPRLLQDGSEWYRFETIQQDGTNYVKIIFDSSIFAAASSGEIVNFVVYQKPESGSSVNQGLSYTYAHGAATGSSDSAENQRNGVSGGTAQGLADVLETW